MINNIQPGGKPQIIPQAVTDQGYKSQFDEMIDVFKLCAKGEVKNDYVTDKKTPDGMKIASADALEYRFYVPTSWICDTEDGASQAYVDESGKPNVSVTAYIPDDTVHRVKVMARFCYCFCQSICFRFSYGITFNNGTSGKIGNLVIVPINESYFGAGIAIDKMLCQKITESSTPNDKCLLALL